MPSGRPRDPHIDTAVLEATLDVLDEVGYGRLTIEEVARQAGTTKPAIYRRWPTRQHLALAALAVRICHSPVPDTGCTLCDLDEAIGVFVAAFRRLRPGVLAALFADCAPVPELRDAFLATLFQPPRAAVGQMLDRAVARGDLRDDVDRELVLDMLSSVVHYRALFGHASTSDADVAGTVDALLAGIAVDYPRLVEHSRRLAGDPRLHPSHS
jgi:AcrR family transcriptional regulator